MFGIEKYPGMNMKSIDSLRLQPPHSQKGDILYSCEDQDQCWLLSHKFGFKISFRITLLDELTYFTLPVFLTQTQVNQCVRLSQVPC